MRKPVRAYSLPRLDAPAHAQPPAKTKDERVNPPPSSPPHRRLLFIPFPCRSPGTLGVIHCCAADHPRSKAFAYSRTLIIQSRRRRISRHFPSAHRISLPLAYLSASLARSCILSSNSSYIPACRICCPQSHPARFRPAPRSVRSASFITPAEACTAPGTYKLSASPQRSILFVLHTCSSCMSPSRPLSFRGSRL